jgi:hypothetical protein
MNARNLVIGSLTVLAVMTFVCGTTSAQDGEVKREDRRVERLLQKLDWKYTIDSSRDFKLQFNVSEDRSQVVFVQSTTHDIDNIELREIWSPAIKVSADQCSKLAMDLLHENSKVKLGSWQLVRIGDSCVAIFCVKVGADCDEKTLRTAIRVVLKTADDKEKELADADTF